MYLYKHKNNTYKFKKPFYIPINRILFLLDEPEKTIPNELQFVEVANCALVFVPCTRLICILGFI